MNERVRRILMERKGRGDFANRGGRRGGSYGRGSRMDGHYREDDPEMYGMHGGRYDYESGSSWGAEDGRRGVKGTGPYGIGGRRYYGRDRGSMPFEVAGEIEYDDDYGWEDCEEYDYARSGRGRRGGSRGRGYDYASGEMDDLRLSKQEIKMWGRELINSDGTKGEHYKLEQIMPVAQQVGIRFDEFTDKEFCLVVNMLYSDYCEVTRKFVAPDKELKFYVELAKAWLDDDDGPEPSEKLALYFNFVVDGK